MKITLTFIFSLAITTIFAQTSNFIELAVDDMIELAPESARIEIQLESADEQMQNKFYNDMYDEYDYEEYEYYESEEDWEYEQMLEESPKKITKEMKKEYEERQERRKERELEEQKKEEQREKEMEEFEPITLSDLRSKLDKLGIKYRTVKNSDESLFSDYDMYDEWDESHDVADSSLEVVLTSTNDWSRLVDGMKDMSTNLNILDVKYGAMDEKLNELIPKLTEKAKKQAQTMAKSINRKLGKVIECTNVYPYTPSAKYLSNYTRGLDVFSNSRNNTNPFESKKEELVQYVYRFSLLN